jgi:hypothetical protein
VIGWREIEKPRVTIRPKTAADVQEEQNQPLSFWGWVLRFLPVWGLLIVMLILAPSLPIQAAKSVVRWVGNLLPNSPPPSVEPVFIVENPDAIPPQSDLPTPNWSLEIAPFFTPEVQYWRDSIARWSLTYRIRPNMIATLLQIESCGDPTVVSEAGAQGLFQVLSLHFTEDEDPFDPETNARRGLEYFAEMLASANGDPGLAFAAYNGGPSVFYSSPTEWPQETQDYQFWGSGIYEEAEMNLQESPTLLEWLAAGGAALCQRAAATLGLSAGTE